jgi:signal transduction histidine kinase
VHQIGYTASKNNHQAALRQAYMEGHPRQAPWRFHFSVLAPSLAMVALVTVLAINVVNVLGAVRAYVGGESLWSKARSEAVQHLLRYGKTRDPDELVSFHEALKIPEGDRLAREAMSQPVLDHARARAQLIAGGNHPDDVDNMIVLFRRFGDQWVFKESLVAWVRGDELITQLKTQAAHLQTLIATNGPSSQINEATATIQDLNSQLKTAELQFSASLGQASRVTELLLIVSVLVIALTVSTVSIVMTRRTLASQAAHQADLSAINKRWELASASAGLGVYELESANGLVQLDAKAASLHGLDSRPTVIPRDMLNAMILPEDVAPARHEVDAALSTGAVFSMMYRIQLKGQGIRTLAATGRLVRRDGESSTRMVGVVRDVTDEQAQAEMAVRRDAAERVTKAQREFLSRLSHELRTPLNAILGFAQLMLLDGSRPLQPTHSRQTELILTAGKQLLALIEDVMDLSKVESGDIPMSLQPVDIVQSVRACMALIDGARDRLNITVTDQLPDRPMRVQADPQRLQQVVMNLLSNACKYNRQDGQIIVAARQEGAHVLIDISDTGIGLSEDEAAQLFQPFKRITPKPQIEGTGLGLYIVRQLVERMNGQVNVSSEKGVGSRFTITLPIAALLP